MKPDGSTKSLEVIADEVEALGTAALRAMKLALADDAFRMAPPNHCHLVMAILAIEGMAEVLTVNWDMCVENAGVKLGHTIRPTISAVDRAMVTGGARMHKLHGCASVPESLLVTTAEISAPPYWAGIETDAALSSGTVVFVGLGTVASYVRSGLQHVIRIRPNGASVWVVARTISPDWDDILGPGIGERRATDAEEFLDELLRSILQSTLVAATEQALLYDQDGSIPHDRLTEGMARVVNALNQVPAMDVWQYLAGARHGFAAGSSVLTDARLQQALLVLAVLARSGLICGRASPVVLETPTHFIEVSVVNGVSASVASSRDSERIRERWQAGRYGLMAKPLAQVVSGHVGALPHPTAPVSILAPTPVGSLLGAGLPPVVHWIDAQSVLNGTQALP